ncbi:MAG: hypothetical protein LBC33_01275 [Mycoplasmataceae bacterium]|nr:hypothetical protein [Mycoplasmataceae bacterium]
MIFWQKKYRNPIVFIIELVLFFPFVAPYFLCHYFMSVYWWICRLFLGRLVNWKAFLDILELIVCCTLLVIIVFMVSFSFSVIPSPIFNFLDVIFIEENLNNYFKNTPLTQITFIFDINWGLIRMFPEYITNYPWELAGWFFVDLPIVLTMIYLAVAMLISATCKRSLHNLLQKARNDLTHKTKHRHTELILVCRLVGYRQLAYLIRRIENNYLLKDINPVKGTLISGNNNEQILYNKEFWPGNIAFITEHVEMNGPLNWLLSASYLKKNILVFDTSSSPEFNTAIKQIADTTRPGRIIWDFGLVVDDLIRYNPFIGKTPQQIQLMITRMVTTDLIDEQQVHLYRVVIDSLARAGQSFSLHELPGSLEYDAYKRFYDQHRKIYPVATTALIDQMLVKNDNNKLYLMFIHLHKLVVQFNRYTRHIFSSLTPLEQTEVVKQKEFEKNDKHYIRQTYKRVRMSVNAVNLDMLTSNSTYRLIYVNIPHSFPLSVRQWIMRLFSEDLNWSSKRHTNGHNCAVYIDDPTLYFPTNELIKDTLTSFKKAHYYLGVKVNYSAHHTSRINELNSIIVNNFKTLYIACIKTSEIAHHLTPVINGCRGVAPKFQFVNLLAHYNYEAVVKTPANASEMSNLITKLEPDQIAYKTQFSEYEIFGTKHKLVDIIYTKPIQVMPFSRYLVWARSFIGTRHAKTVSDARMIHQN